MIKYTSYKILPDLNLILGNFQGKILLKDLIELNVSIFTDKDFNPAYDVLLDFTQSRLIGYRIDVPEYISFFRKSIQLPKKVRLGIIFSSSNQKFLFTIYKTFGNLLKLDIEDFQKIDNCLSWMEFPEESKRIIIDALNSIKSNTVDLE